MYQAISTMHYDCKIHYTIRSSSFSQDVQQAAEQPKKKKGNPYELLKICSMCTPSPFPSPPAVKHLPTPLLSDTNRADYDSFWMHPLMQD